MFSLWFVVGDVMLAGGRYHTFVLACRLCCARLRRQGKHEASRTSVQWISHGVLVDLHCQADGRNQWS